MENSIPELRKSIKDAVEQKKYLNAIFPLINLSKQNVSENSHFVIPRPISRELNFPVKKDSSTDATNFEDFSDKLDYNVLNLNTILYLFEKYGSFIPADDKTRNLSCYSNYKIRKILEQQQHNNNFTLISLDFSGIQDFIYTISSKGALKMLRSRSFYLELLGEHILNELLETIKGNRSNVIFSGGGSFLLLVPKQEETLDKVSVQIAKINDWLFDKFLGKLYLAFAQVDITLPTDDWPEDIAALKVPREIFEKLARQLEKNKRHKFQELVLEGIAGKVFNPKPPHKKTDQEECCVCHRDDDFEEEKDGENVYCPICLQLYKIGSSLPNIQLVAITRKPQGQNYLEIDGSYYVLLTEDEKLPEPSDVDRLLVLDPNINEADILQYPLVPLFTAQYARRHGKLPKKVREKTEEKMSAANEEPPKSEHMATFEGLAEAALGAKRIGVLRMDVDNLGLIVSRGLADDNDLISLSDLMRLSNELNYFFKLHLDEICYGSVKEPTNVVKQIAGDYIKDRGGRDVVVVYSGGDDLFIVGAWNDVAELGIDIQKAFTKYTCTNSDITLSGGFTIHDAKYPIHRMAELAGAAEEAAKENKLDCRFGSDNSCSFDVCQLKEKISLSNIKCLRKNSYAPFYSPYIKAEKKKLEDNNKSSPYPERIKLAFKWDKELTPHVLDIVEYFIKTGFESNENLKDNRSLALNQKMPRALFFKLFNMVDIWRKEGLLYLPQLAWVLGRMKELRQKDNQANGDNNILPNTLIDLLDFNSKDKMATLHIPLTWLDLLHRGGE